MAEEASKEINWVNKLYMLHENELWLDEQAQKGLFVKSFAKDYACFMGSDPKDVAYKIVILDREKAHNQVKIIEHQGFTFVESHFEYYIFYIDGKYRHIQPRLNEEMTRFVKQWFNKQMLNRFAGTMIALIPFIINLVMDRDRLLQNIVEIPAILFVSMVLILSVCFVESIKGYKALGRNKKYYLAHEFYQIRKSSKKPRWIVLITAFILLGFSALKCLYFEPHAYSIDKVQKTMPIVLLQNLEQDRQIRAELKKLQKTKSEGNYAEINNGFFAPKQYVAYQENIYDVNYNSMTIRYYEVSVKILAIPLAKELPVKSWFDIKWENFKEIKYEGLDKVYFYNDGYMDFISVCKGNRVMFILYNGDKSASDILKEIAEVL